MNLDPQLPARLAELLSQPLPGWRAQGEFQPELSYGRHFGPPPASARPAAVIALLYPYHNRWHLPLTLRPDTLTDHPGQISLPGGSVELGERGQDTAVRELGEELGVAADAVQALGELSPLYVFNSNYRATAWVAVAAERPRWQPQTNEVAELFEIPLDYLLDPANRGHRERSRYGVRSQCPGFLWGRHHIWGFTSMVLAELLCLVSRASENPEFGALEPGALPARPNAHNPPSPSG